MSTSDQQEHGPLTRKQLREIRLTGSTPVISAEQATAAADAASAPPEAPMPSDTEPETTPPAAAADAAEPQETPPAQASRAGVAPDVAPLTRRQVREQERIKTASVPVVGAAERFTADEAPRPDTPTDSDTVDDVVIAVPQFSAPDQSDDANDDVDAASESAPEEDAVAAVAALGIEVDSPDEVVDADDEDDVLADAGVADDADIAPDERPTVSPMFGQGVLTEPEEPQKPFSPSFDELLTVGDSTGSQNVAPNTLIFTPGPGEGSLSGPVASTGEILVTGSYELPKGLGSRGHAHGTTDGKEVDAVLIDGELPPASSPTPIAASAAVSTIKPAGEVIRPPAPEKGNKLMLTLAIVTGGLALAVAVALIVAFTTNVF